jgi:hypothetical protein
MRVARRGHDELSLLVAADCRYQLWDREAKAQVSIFTLCATSSFSRFDDAFSSREPVSTSLENALETAI